MDSIYKFFLLAAGITVTAVLVFLGFRAANAAKNVGNEAIDGLISFSTEIDEAKLMQYNGATVSGSDVVNLIKKTFGTYPGAKGFVIKVTDNVNDNSFTDDTHLKDIQNFSSSFYINPSGRYLGTVIRNANGIISEIDFVKQ